jgi:Putative prokaryotic signal transducing protein
MSDTRSETEWRLLMTATDAPTAALLAGMLEAGGVRVRIASDAVVLGQAAPARIYVDAAQLRRAESLVASVGGFTDEELARLASGDPASD